MDSSNAKDAKSKNMNKANNTSGKVEFGENLDSETKDATDCK